MCVCKPGIQTLQLDGSSDELSRFEFGKVKIVRIIKTGLGLFHLVRSFVTVTLRDF